MENLRLFIQAPIVLLRGAWTSINLLTVNLVSKDVFCRDFQFGVCSTFVFLWKTDFHDSLRLFCCISPDHLFSKGSSFLIISDLLGFAFVQKGLLFCLGISDLIFWQNVAWDTGEKCQKVAAVLSDEKEGIGGQKCGSSVSLTLQTMTTWVLRFLWSQHFNLLMKIR